MSDTTTITAEEMAIWSGRLHSSLSCLDERHARFTLRLIDAFGAAVERAEKAEAANARLREQLEALKWLREAEAFTFDSSFFELCHDAMEELENTYESARRAVAAGEVKTDTGEFGARHV